MKDKDAAILIAEMDHLEGLKLYNNGDEWQQHCEWAVYEIEFLRGLLVKTQIENFRKRAVYMVTQCKTKSEAIAALESLPLIEGEKE